MIIKNDKTVSSIYKGGTLINKIYKGVDLLFSSSLLPSEYQQVEYIENAGKQYIDTGFIPTGNTGVELIYQAINATSSQYILGCRAGDYGTIYYAVNGSSSRNDWDIRLGGGAIYSSVERTTNKYKSEISLSGGSGTWTLTNLDTLASNTFKIGTTAINATANLCLFAYSSMYIHSNLRIYECKIYEAGELIRHFIPCYRKSDNVIGMYDVVAGIFYTNKGSGTFLKGK